MHLPSNQRNTAKRVISLKDCWGVYENPDEIPEHERKEYESVQKHR
jgi:hypothetical protein